MGIRARLFEKRFSDIEAYYPRRPPLGHLDGFAAGTAPEIDNRAVVHVLPKRIAEQYIELAAVRVDAAIRSRQTRKESILRYGKVCSGWQSNHL